MWRNYFKHLYNSVQNNGAQNVLNERLIAYSVAKNTMSFTISYVIDIIWKQKLGKAKLDLMHCIKIEASVHEGPKLAIHICFLFKFVYKIWFFTDVCIQ